MGRGWGARRDGWCVAGSLRGSGGSCGVVEVTMDDFRPEWVVRARC